MSAKDSFRCDICGTELSAPNGMPTGFIVNDQLYKFKCFPFEASCTSEQRNLKHACSQSCVHKLFDRFLTETTLEWKNV